MEWIVRNCLKQVTKNFGSGLRKWFIDRVVNYIDYYERRGFYIEHCIFTRPNFAEICTDVSNYVPKYHEGNKPKNSQFWQLTKIEKVTPVINMQAEQTIFNNYKVVIQWVRGNKKGRFLYRPQKYRKTFFFKNKTKFNYC